MKYSMKALDDAIAKVEPIYGKLKEKHCNSPRSEWVKIVAEKYFLTYFMDEDKRDYELMSAYYVCHRALKELHSEGYFTFGNEDSYIK